VRNENEGAKTNKQTNKQTNERTNNRGGKKNELSQDEKYECNIERNLDTSTKQCISIVNEECSEENGLFLASIFSSVTRSEIGVGRRM
jgi:hypothetical protein